MSEEIARATWQRLDHPGHDSCRLVRAEGGYMLVGHARWREAAGDHALDYVVRLDADFTTLGADVTGQGPAGALAWKIARDEDGWTLDGDAVPACAECRDLDLAFTPATNLLPLRRCRPATGETIAVTAAWFRPGQATLTALPQTYTPRDDGHVLYTSPTTSVSVDLAVAPSGFVLQYPGFWTGEVHDA